MLTLTIDCKIQLDLPSNPNQELINEVVSKINRALHDAELSAQPHVIPESTKIGEIKDKHEDAKLYYRALTDAEQDVLLKECPDTGEEDFFEWLTKKREADICVHKHCVCEKK